MAVATLGPVFPSLKATYTDEVTKAAAAAIAAVRKASVNPSIGVLVGGPIFLSHPGLAAEVGADAVAVDGALAPDIAAKLVETRAIPC